MAKTADMIAAALTTPIGVAVVPLRTVAMNAAEQRAEGTIAYVTTEIAKHDGDVNAAAPYPSSRNTWGVEYHKAKARYALFHTLVTADASKRQTHRMGEPYWVVMSAERATKFIADARDMAASQYDMFVMKLNHKVGAHVAASLEGNHVWGFSFLTVTFAGDKPAEIWMTQQIWNVSKLGKDFPQWPSRKVKGAR